MHPNRNLLPDEHGEHEDDDEGGDDDEDVDVIIHGLGA